MLALVQVLKESLLPVVTAPAGWNLIAEHSIFEAGWGTWYQALYYRVATAPEPASYTWTYNTVAGSGIAIATYRDGFDLASPIDVSSSLEYITSDTILKAGSVTTTHSEEYLIFAGGMLLSSASTPEPMAPPAGFTENVDTGQQAYQKSFAISTTPQASAGASGNMDATLQSAIGKSKHAFLVALKKP